MNSKIADIVKNSKRFCDMYIYSTAFHDAVDFVINSEIGKESVEKAFLIALEGLCDVNRDIIKIHTDCMNTCNKQILKNKIKLLEDTLCMCDPRENYGEGTVCQFCGAKDGEYHKEDCKYRILTTVNKTTGKLKK